MDPLIDLGNTLLQAAKDAREESEQQKRENLALQAEVAALTLKCAGLESELRFERIRADRALETEKMKSAGRTAALRVAEEQLREARAAAADGLAEAAKTLQRMADRQRGLPSASATSSAVRTPAARKASERFVDDDSSEGFPMRRTRRRRSDTDDVIKPLKFARRQRDSSPDLGEELLKMFGQPTNSDSETKNHPLDLFSGGGSSRGA
ncbi:hypothetical protein C8R46DRAFT_1196743 [Mycena filopes]|nr:hypothetical protein C8R46DRAFT_1196743 [Mycena filopes]